MFGWLTTTIGTLLSLLTFVEWGQKSNLQQKHYRVVQWSVAVRAHNQFGSWT
jgi:hypothetical protein